MAGLLRRGLGEEGLVRRRRAHRRRRALDGGGDRVRRDRARRDAAGDRRLRRLPPAARGGHLDAGAHAHGARRGRRPRRGPRRGRGRLPHEAVLVRRAARAATRARAACSASSDRRSSRSATSALDPATRQVWRGEAEIGLSAKEFALLETFMRRPGEVLSRFQLLEHCWDYAYENRSNVVDVYVRYLREKIDRPFGRSSIETVRGAGYRLQAGRRRAAMSRIPIRIRLTLAFALAMAVVLAAIGAFLYLRLGSSLDEAIDESLQARAAEVTAQVERGDDVDRQPASPTSVSSRSSTPTAIVVAGTPRGRRAAPRRGRARTRARHARPGSSFDARRRARGRIRVLAAPVDTAAAEVCSSASSLEDRDEAVRGFLDAAPRRGAGRAAPRLAARLRARDAGAAPGRVHAARGRGDLGVRARPPASAARSARRDLPPGRDAERHARPTRVCARAGAGLRRRRQPRAAHAARASEGRARARAAAAALRGRAEPTPSAPRPRRPIVSPSSPRTSSCSRGRIERSSRSSREPLRVQELLDTVAARFERRATDAGRAIEVEDTETLEVRRTRSRLEQALGNLVDNALGTATARSGLSARTRDGRRRASRPRRGPGLPGRLPPARVRPLRAPTTRARAPARASASRSPRPSLQPMEDRRTRRTWAKEGATCGCRCRGVRFQPCARGSSRRSRRLTARARRSCSTRRTAAQSSSASRPGRRSASIRCASARGSSSSTARWRSTPATTRSRRRSGHAPRIRADRAAYRAEPRRGAPAHGLRAVARPGPLPAGLTKRRPDPLGGRLEVRRVDLVGPVGLVVLDVEPRALEQFACTTREADLHDRIAPAVSDEDARAPGPSEVRLPSLHDGHEAGEREDAGGAGPSPPRPSV